MRETGFVRYKPQNQQASVAKLRFVVPPVVDTPVETVPAALPRKSKIKIRWEPEARVAISGEIFLVGRRGKGVRIHHPRWSLMGAGKTFRDAEIALRHEASIVVRVYGSMSPAALDDEAAKQFAYAIRIAIP